MSYEEIDKITATATDVFTGGAEGRYSKPKPTTADGELKVKKKKAPVAEEATVEEKVKVKKQVDSTNTSDSVETKKERKKKAPKIEKTNEIYENLSETNETPTGRKKKTKASIAPPTSDPLTTDTTITESDERTTKRTKKSRAPKIPDETIEQIPVPVPMETTGINLIYFSRNKYSNKKKRIERSPMIIELHSFASYSSCQLNIFRHNLSNISYEHESTNVIEYNHLP